MIIVMEMKAKSNISSINQRKGEMNDEKSVNPFALTCGLYSVFSIQLAFGKLKNCSYLERCDITNMVDVQYIHTTYILSKIYGNYGC